MIAVSNEPAQDWAAREGSPDSRGLLVGWVRRTLTCGTCGAERGYVLNAEHTAAATTERRVRAEFEAAHAHEG